MKKNQIPFFGSVLCLLIAYTLIVSPISLAAQQQHGPYITPESNVWQLSPQSSPGDYFHFENTQTGVSVNILKNPIVCETKQEFNSVLLKIIQELPKTQEFMELRKQAVTYQCLGQKYCHMLVIKSRATGQRRFLLSPYFEGKIYHIEVAGGGNQSTAPPPEALEFISQVSLEGQPMLATQTTVPGSQNSNKQTVPQQNLPTQSLSQNSDDALSSFKKNKSVAPPPEPASPKTDIKTAPTQTAPNNNPSKTPLPKNPTPNASSFKNPDIKAPLANLPKEPMPEAKFSATNPCSPKNSGDNGMPWETLQASKIETAKRPGCGHPLSHPWA